MSTLHTNTAPRQLAVNRKDVAELIDLIAGEVIRRIDQRETSRMISNAVRDGVTKHLEAQRTAAKAEPEDIFANYRIDDPESAADYLNNLQGETK